MDRPDDAPHASHDLRDLHIVTPHSRSAHTRERRATIIGGRTTLADRRGAWWSFALHVAAAIAVAALLSRSSDDVIVVPPDFHITLEGRIASPASPAPPVPSVTPEPKAAIPAAPTSGVSKPDAKGAIVPKPDRPVAKDRPTPKPPAPSRAAIAAPVSAPSHSAVLAPNEIRVGSGGGVTGNFPFTYYLNGVRAAIQRHWSPPRGSASGGTLDATVRFTIARDGSVRDVAVEERSGVSSFDQAAATAVRRAAPFAPLPHDYRNDDLVVHLGFHYAE